MFDVSGMKNDIIELDRDIRQTINKINNSIKHGKFVEYDNELSYEIYNSLLQCQIVELCLREDIKEIDAEFLYRLDENVIEAAQEVEISVSTIYQEIQRKASQERQKLKESIFTEFCREDNAVSS